MNNWFEVDKKGLRALYADKPKTFIINELVQNAFDENITLCKLDIKYSKVMGSCNLTIEDDSSEGFKNMSHAYTLFADTYKRKDPTKRGKFNLGEKLVISLCDYAEIKTTKGTIIFTSDGRKEFDSKTANGTIVKINFDASKEQVDDIIKHTKTILVPLHIKFIVNDEVIPSKSIYKSFRASLKTEILKGDILVSRWRETTINLIQHNDNTSYIYEIGIPIQSTDCPYHIDVQQKVLLNLNRDTIAPRYLQDLYAEILNNIYNELKEEDSSALWVRTGLKDKKIHTEAINGIMKNRYGDKYCIANPKDTHSMEEAISKGYNIIYGSELSKEEWSKIKEHTNIQSTTQLFGENHFALAKNVAPTENMKIVKQLVKKIAKRILNIDVTVQFVDTKKATTLADYNRTNHTLRFNVGRLPKNFFDNPISVSVIDLIIHELGHEQESMVEYHKLLTKIGANLTFIAFKEPKFFEVD